MPVLERCSKSIKCCACLWIILLLLVAGGRQPVETVHLEISAALADGADRQQVQEVLRDRFSLFGAQIHSMTVADNGEVNLSVSGEMDSLLASRLVSRSGRLLFRRVAPDSLVGQLVAQLNRHHAEVTGDIDAYQAHLDGLSGANGDTMIVADSLFSALEASEKSLPANDGYVPLIVSTPYAFYLENQDRPALAGYLAPETPFGLSAVSAGHHFCYEYLPNISEFDDYRDQAYVGFYVLLPDSGLTTHTYQFGAIDALEEEAEVRYYNLRLRMGNFQASAFGEMTAAHVGERVAILLDDEVLFAPRINARIISGEIVLSAQDHRVPGGAGVVVGQQFLVEFFRRPQSGEADFDIAVRMKRIPNTAA